jgi:uncharacterized protein YerC
MSDISTTAEAQDRRRQLRKELIGNGATKREIADALGCSTRTIDRMKLPRIGDTKIFDVDATAALLQRRSPLKTT